MKLAAVFAIFAVLAAPARAQDPVWVWQGLLQQHLRVLESPRPQGLNEGFLAPRIRGSAQATWPALSLRVQALGGEGRLDWEDAYLELLLGQGFSLRLGRFKVPLGLEAGRDEAVQDWAEPGFCAGLLSLGDQGVLLRWEDERGLVQVEGAVVNGGQDGEAPLTDTDSDKDAVGRVYLRPFRAARWEAWRNLGLGWAASGGHRSQLLNLPRYASPAGVPLFRYHDGTHFDGQVWRVAPQAAWRWDRVDLRFELAKSEFQAQRVSGTGGTNSTFLHHDAFQVQGLWALGGARVDERGLGRAEGSAWDAWALLGRYQELRFDSGTYDRVGETRFASLRESVSRAESWSVGLACLPRPDLRVQLTWTQTRFRDGAQDADGRQRDREPEGFLLLQVQMEL